MPTVNTRLEQLAEIARTLETTRRKRDRIIIKARSEGVPLRTIADAAGISYQTVFNIEKKQRATTPAVPRSEQ
jgi:DNA invertase Pin-like site-specific DNA recombinase